MTVDIAYFDAMHAESADPFGFRGSWYEARKRSLLLASLPRQHYERAWELGCSIGELTAALAPRCGALLATDGASQALVHADARTAAWPHVRTALALQPGDWADGTFDLIVFSEIGYYLQAATLAAMVPRLVQSLAPGGTLVACHWRHAFDPAPLHGDQVHDILRQDVSLPHMFQYQDADFVLDGWSSMTGSLAQQENRR